ncbi:hypothetical protein J1N35_018058 [Gossypium stocksii]|uniref:Retrotransposon Copia-like N-terminal domain-containing protein n=1 Tax=Gossypium stocksii TaxID=47602 RepID=A0A9D3VN99_9ROSI|nr:hypothetical protein J1N35_018058 [Gossypium stocksii]
MATMTSTDFNSVEPSLAAFNGDHVVNSFPCHEVVKLTDETYIQWQQQVRLILNGYNLIGFLDGFLSPPARFVQSLNKSLALNLLVRAFKQQDRLLTSWFLSMISASLLLSFTDTRSTCDVWTTVTDLFSVYTSAKQSYLRHELHSVKKGPIASHGYRSVMILLPVGGMNASYEEMVSDEWVFPQAECSFFSNGSSNNHMQVGPSLDLGSNVRLTGGVLVPWHTKPQAHIYSSSDQCSGLPGVGDLHASDHFDTFGSHINTAQVGSNDGVNDSYISMPVGMSSLLMGSGTPTQISSVGNGVLPTPSKLLQLSRVLCV